MEIHSLWGDPNFLLFISRKFSPVSLRGGLHLPSDLSDEGVSCLNEQPESYVLGLL